MKNLIKKIQNTAFQNKLWKKGEKIILGVSGGPDSVCLLDILSKISKKNSLSLLIAHINYGLRENDSDADEKFVRSLGEKYSLPVKIFKPNLKKKGFSLKNFSEDNLRRLRYDFFEKTRELENFDLIAVGHNADDQIETFLMRLLRGSGLRGLSGMRPRNEKIIRPLLETFRDEIIDYLKNNQLLFRIDKSNQKNFFFRNKIRNKILPYLKKNSNPNLKKTLLKTTAHIAEDYDFLDRLAQKKSSSQKTLRVSALRKNHPSLQKKMVFNFLEKHKGDLKNIESSHIKEILKMADSAKSKKQVFIFQGLKIRRRDDIIEAIVN